MSIFDGILKNIGGAPDDVVNLAAIVGAIGGEGSLANFASMIDRDGDGNPVNDILGMAKGLFGKS